MTEKEKKNELRTTNRDDEYRGSKKPWPNNVITGP
jgi:hypothetical protein